MKKSIFLLLIIFSFGFLPSFAQQVKKEGKYSMQSRQEKLRYSSPGDISLKTYSSLDKVTLSGKMASPKQTYKKEKPAYRSARKSAQDYDSLIHLNSSESMGFQGKSAFSPISYMTVSLT